MSPKKHKFEGTGLTNIVSPEDIRLNTKYTLNINPNDDHQYWQSDERVKLSSVWMQYSIDNIDAQINVQMEISRLGRLHFHGTIEWIGSNASVLAFFMDSLRSLLSKATINISEIQSLTEWNEYCNKGSIFNLPKFCTSDAKTKRLKNVEKPFTVKFKDITAY